MKKLILFISMLLGPYLIYGQTVTPPVITQQKFDSTMTELQSQVQQQILIYLQAYQKQVDSYFKVITFQPPKPVYNFTMPGALASKAISYSNLNGTPSSYKLISGLSFDQKGDSVTCISLSNCNYVHITLCRFTNTRAFSVDIENCTNVIVDSCFITNVAQGPMAQNSKSIQFINNQVLNINGNALWKGHAFNFNNVSGTRNLINNNKIENIAGVAKYPHDMISVISCNPSDTLYVIGNWIRGGQINYRPKMIASSDGATGIALGDGTGSKQVARNNILVNPAGSGFQTVGSGTGIVYDHNIVYIKLPANSLINPIGVSVQDNQPVYVGYNRVLVYRLNGLTTMNTRPINDGLPSFWNSPTSPTPIAWNTNKWQDLTLNENILPQTIITYK